MSSQSIAPSHMTYNLLMWSSMVQADLLADHLVVSVHYSSLITCHLGMLQPYI